MDVLEFVSQWRQFTKAYGRLWLGLTLVFPSLPEFVQDIERHILDRTEESISEFRNKQVTLLSNTGTTAAIISQVTVTSIQLNDVENVHWAARGFFYLSLLSSLLSVFLSFLKHRDMISTSNSGLRLQLSAHTRFRLFQKKRLNMAVVVALYLPYTSLNAAIIAYIMGMSTYLTARGIGLNWTTESDNINILMVFNLALFTGGLAYMCTKLTGTKVPPTSGSTRGRNILHVGNILQPELNQTQQTNMPHTPTLTHTNDEAVIEMAALPSYGSIELFKALVEAAAAHKAAAAASEAVANHYERVSLSCFPIRHQEHRNTPTGK